VRVCASCPAASGGSCCLASASSASFRLGWVRVSGRASGRGVCAALRRESSSTAVGRVGEWAQSALDSLRVLGTARSGHREGLLKQEKLERTRRRLRNVA
jgi:hypothetical protein